MGRRLRLGETGPEKVDLTRSQPILSRAGTGMPVDFRAQGLAPWLHALVADRDEGRRRNGFRPLPKHRFHQATCFALFAAVGPYFRSIPGWAWGQAEVRAQVKIAR